MSILSLWHCQAVEPSSCALLGLGVSAYIQFNERTNHPSRTVLYECGKSCLRGLAAERLAPGGIPRDLTWFLERVSCFKQLRFDLNNDGVRRCEVHNIDINHQPWSNIL